MEDWFHAVDAWHEFYTFAGTAAATLMGLLFVVMSLGQRTLATEEGKRATRGFFTPIVIFFASVIVVSMFMLIPATTAATLAAMIAAVAAVGLFYMAASGVHRIWRTSGLGYDDLMWYVALPYLSYLLIAVAAIAIWKSSPSGLYTASAAMVLLLLTGIRNAWDLVVYNIQRGSD